MINGKIAKTQQEIHDLAVAMKDEFLKYVPFMSVVYS